MGDVSVFGDAVVSIVDLQALLIDAESVDDFLTEVAVSVDALAAGR